MDKPASAATTSSLKPQLPKGVITTGMMMVLLITSIVSLRGLPSQAEYGLTTIFYFVLAAILYFIPYALVCAELASAYHYGGGVFRWVGEAFGTRWGWSAIYLDWIFSVTWFPAELMFGATALAYIFWPETFDATLSSNRIYTVVLMLAIYWGCTLNTFRGMAKANRFGSVGGVCGTIFPAAVLIVMAVVYILLGKTVNLPLDRPFWPDLGNIDNVVLAASIFLFYSGMEVPTVHVQQMAKPARQFPKAVFGAVIVILAIFILGTLAVGVIIPQKDINLLQSLLVCYHDLWASIGVPWLGNVMAVLITFGVVAQVSVLLGGPSTGLLSAGQAGFLPVWLQHTNRHGVQTTILLVQAAVVSIITLVLLVLPSVQSAYQVLSQLSTIIYLLMILLVYGSCLWLRHTQPGKIRAYRIPGGWFGVWAVVGTGIVGAVLAAVISFFPPSQISVGGTGTYMAIIIIGLAVFVAIPFIIYSLRKASWLQPGHHFYPFDWHIEGRKPSQKSQWPAGYEPSKKELDKAVSTEGAQKP